MWYQKILEANRDKLQKILKTNNDLITALTELYQGIGVKKFHVKDALKATNLEDKGIENFNTQDSKKFSAYLRKISKPTLIVANKIDVPNADKNFHRLRERYNDMIIVPASADSELTLRTSGAKRAYKIFTRLRAI